MLKASRATIAVKYNQSQLRIIALEGNDAIPLSALLPMDGTMIGRVVRAGVGEICQDTSASSDADCQMLYSKGVLSCMDLPLISGRRCFGSLNIGRPTRGAFTELERVKMQALAHWLACNVRIHQQVEEMKRLSDTDPLTGVLNRRAFSRRFQAMLDTPPAERGGLGLALLDLDHFKSINDVYGHAMGDAVLVKVCQLLVDSCRQSDIVARLGGEEFCVVLRNVDAPTMMEILQRFMTTLRRTPITHEAERVFVSASIGALVVGETEAAQDRWLALADAAMYRAKRGGRDRVVLSTDGSEAPAAVEATPPATVD